MVILFSKYFIATNSAFHGNFLNVNVKKRAKVQIPRQTFFQIFESLKLVQCFCCNALTQNLKPTKGQMYIHVQLVQNTVKLIFISEVSISQTLGNMTHFKL